MFHKLKFFAFTVLIFCISILFNTSSFASNTSNLPNLEFFLDLQEKAMHLKHANDNRQVVRIGYKENYGVIKIPSIDGLEGYGYEYLNAVFKQMEDKYKPEFVLVEWSEGLEMLEKGDIDILAGANYTTERGKKFLFASDVFCIDSLLLVALKTNDFLNYDAINGATVCVQAADALLPMFYKFLEKNNLHPIITEKNFGSVHRERQAKEFDFILTSSMQMDSDLNVVATITSAATYLMFNHERSELLHDINTACYDLDVKDNLFKERLFLKYYDNVNITRGRVTKEELEILQEKPRYNMGVIDLNSPYSYIDSDGKLQGIVVDIMGQVSELAGVEFNVIEINKETPKEVLENLELSFISKKDEEKYSFPKSKPIIQYPYALLESNIDLPEELLGTADYYNLDIEDINFFVQNQRLKEYSSVDKLIKAFNTGEVHNMILSSSILAQHFSEITRKDYTSRNLNYWYTPTISYAPFFPETKIEVIDKLLAQINKYAIENDIAKHITILATKDEFFYLYQYRYELIFGLFFSLLVFYLVFKRMKNKKEKEMQDMEDFDALTGLYSFSRFQKTVLDVLEKDLDSTFSIISVNIDNFRYINEMHGFDIGDAVLKHVAYHIQQHMSDPLPLAARGDNFLILVKTNKLSNRSGMDLRVEKLNQELAKYLGKTYTLSFSVGVYNIVDRSIDPSLMIDFANIARNKSKASFGTTIEIYSEEMKNAYLEKTEVLANVRYAFQHKEFKLFYQPKFDINRMNIVGAEALIRWFKDGKIIPPDRFIPIIETNNLIDQLDYYVMDMACKFIQDHELLDLPTISINISGHTIIREDVVLKLISIAEDHGISPDKLDLEITESALVDNFNLALDNINLLRQAGFTVSMDDFGAGISSLNRLHKIPIDILKIDRGFIVDALDDPKGAAIIKNVINLARDINVQTVAEGIETLEQLEFLRKLACNVGQGYFFSRPVSERDFIKALQRDRDGQKATGLA